MKEKIINILINYIKKNTNYDDIKLNEIKYGLEGIYLTITKLIIIVILSLILGIFKEMLIYLIIYNIIRMPSFGLHATKSWICLISSLILFIGIPYVSKLIIMPIVIKTIISTLGVLLMFKNSPSDTKKRPIISKKRRDRYKFISTIICITYGFIAIFINNNFISNAIIFSIVMQNIIISPITYKIFNLPYNNYIAYLKAHPEYSDKV